MSLTDTPIGFAVTDATSQAPLIYVGQTTALSLAIVNNSGADIALSDVDNRRSFAVKSGSSTLTRTTPGGGSALSVFDNPSAACSTFSRGPGSDGRRSTRLASLRAPVGS